MLKLVENDMKEQNLFCDDNKIKCYQTELQSVKYMSFEELFQGFDSIKAITFSYDISFIDNILKNFKYGEIIFGANFLVEKDKKTNDFLTNVFTNAHITTKQIFHHATLKEMFENGDVQLKTPTFVLDHRKVYLLSTDDGRKTRVITTSANMTRSAWNGNHMEFYQYDDSPLCYEEFEKDFETAWINSSEIPQEIALVKNIDNPIEGNPILRKVKKVDKVIILKPKEEETIIENVRYMIDFDKLNDQYKQLLSDVKISDKNGIVEILPKTIEKMECNFKKAQQKISTKDVTKNYPEMTIDYTNEKVFINEEELNLNPSEEDVKRDITNFINIFNNFDDFMGDSKKLKDSHYKMLNAIFASPFHAKLRCIAKIKGIETSSLPLYLLVASSTANCGKTFMISAILKMMTNMNITPFNKADLNLDKIKNLQAHKGTPIFIDELDMISPHLKNLLKNPERCEDNQIETMPMLIFASNSVLEPDEILRKRMIFVRLNGKLPSDIDQAAYKSRGLAITRRLGNSFYCEYLRRMLKKVSKELDYIITDKTRPDDYYPDLMKYSSDTIIEILNEYGFEIPDYIRHLTWNNDYSINAKFVSEDAIHAIEKLYKENKKAFSFEKDKIIIELDISSSTRKKCESWKNTLPSEINAEVYILKDCTKVYLNREEFEKRIGYKLGNMFSRFF